MLELWDTVLEPLAAAVAPSSVCLVGAARLLAPRFDGRQVRTIPIDPSSDSFPEELPDLVLVDVEDGATVLETARTFGRMARSASSPPPVLVIASKTGVDGGSHGPLAAIETLQARESGLQLTLIHGLGGAAVAVDESRLRTNDRLAEILGQLAPGSLQEAHLAAVEAARRRALARAEDAERALADAEARLETTAEAAAERDRLRASLAILADDQIDRVERRALVRRPLSPLMRREQTAESHIRERLAELGAGAPELAMPLPADRRGLLARTSDDSPAITVHASDDADALRACIWSLLARADRPFRLAIAIHEDISVAARVVAYEVALRLPHIELRTRESSAERPGLADEDAQWTVVFNRPVVIPHGWMSRVAEHLRDYSAAMIPGTGHDALTAFGVDAAALALGDQSVPDPDAPGIVAVPGNMLDAGSGLAPGKLIVDDQQTTVLQSDPGALPDRLREQLRRDSLKIVYVLPGLPPEGSGGAISVLQEAGELGRLGVDVHVLLEGDGARRARELIPSASSSIRELAPGESLQAGLSDADVVVATESDTVVRIADAVPTRALRAYYVQDYETLFGQPGTAHADAALLSYRRASWGALYAKTHWLANLVSDAHQVPVGKVEPSLDTELFHGEGRDDDHGTVRVVAMVRPRTPRRRAAETIALLERLAEDLPRKLECFSFGCTAGELEELRGGDPLAGVAHLGVLGRPEVAEVMRRCDVFVDLSVYQAFGRTGLEAMACGAVPVLPSLGGVSEYATDGQDAVFVSTPDEALSAVVGLVEDQPRLCALRREGIRSARRFSTLRSAVSQYAFLKAAVGAARAAR